MLELRNTRAPKLRMQKAKVREKGKLEHLKDIATLVGNMDTALQSAIRGQTTKETLQEKETWKGAGKGDWKGTGKGKGPWEGKGKGNGVYSADWGWHDEGEP